MLDQLGLQMAARGVILGSKPKAAGKPKSGSKPNDDAGAGGSGSKPKGKRTTSVENAAGNKGGAADPKGKRLKC